MSRRRRPLLIDTDPGVDDALALLLAFASPEVEVVQITAVAGSARIGAVTENARRLVALAAPSPLPPVSRGAAAPLERRLVTTRPMPVLVETRGEPSLGASIADRRPEPVPGPRVDVALEVQAEAALEFIARRALGCGDPPRPAAGDTFVGYLAAALADGAALDGAVALANRAAARAVTRGGAQPGIPSRRALEDG